MLRAARQNGVMLSVIRLSVVAPKYWPTKLPSRQFTGQCYKPVSKLECFSNMMDKCIFKIVSNHYPNQMLQNFFVRNLRIFAIAKSVCPFSGLV